MKSFKKYNLRINNLEIRNNHEKKPLSPNKDYSLFELVKWFNNKNYEKLQDFYKKGYTDSFLGNSIIKDNKSIDKNVFLNKENCYVIGFFRINYKEPEALKLELDCIRFTELSEDEKIIVNELLKKSTKQIIKQVYKLKNEL